MEAEVVVGVEGTFAKLQKSRNMLRSAKKGTGLMIDQKSRSTPKKGVSSYNH